MAPCRSSAPGPRALTAPSVLIPWVGVTALAQRDPDFVALAQQMHRSPEARRAWVETQVLRRCGPAA